MPAGAPRARSAPLCIALLLLWTVACDQASTARSSTPEAGRFDRMTVLEEGDSTQLARPSAVAQAPNGDIFVSDRLRGLASRYEHDGHLLSTLGRKGAGPGEFESPRAFAFVGDTTVLAFDPGLRRAQLFGYGGTVIGDPVSLPFDFSMAVGSDDGVWIGGSSVEADLAVVRWSPTSDSLVPFFPLPRLFHEYPLLLLLGGAELAASRDTVVMAFGAGNVLYIMDGRSRELLDSIVVPRSKRRGLPDATLETARQGNGFEILNSASALGAVSLLSTGEIAVVHQDLTQAPGNFKSELYLTTLSRSGEPVCVDAPIPQLGEDRPLLEFVGDTLLMLEQELVGADSIRTVVRRLVVDGARRC